MSNQTPQQCKDTGSTKWMFNDQDQTPCQVLSSSIRQFDTSFALPWLDLSLTCPHTSNPTNTTFFSHQLSEFCCSSISFSLFSSCWACQWDQPVDGFLQTTWGNYSSTCSTNGTTGALAVARIGSLSTSVQSTLTAANIHIPTWAFLPVVVTRIWDETTAKANATVTAALNASMRAPNALSAGAIAGISIGSFIFFCVALFAFTVFCMRKKQRHRLEAFRYRSASIFGHKKRVVNMGEKAVGPRDRGQQGAARMDLALEDDGLASPVSVKGGFSGARRVNSDLTMDITHEAMLPTLLGRHDVGLAAPASGVGGVPQQRQRPDSGTGIAARLLARLGRLSQPGRANSPKAQGLTNAPTMNTTTTNSNRHTHPMTQSSFVPRESAPFAVPFSSSDSMNMYSATRPALNSSNSAPPTAWLTSTFDTSAAHPLTQQQLHPQLSRNASSPSSGLPLSTADKPTPMPLTKEALALARVAQDGTLFVLGDEAVNRGSGKMRGSGGVTGSRPTQQQQQQPQHVVRTVSIVRNPAQINRHVEMLPRRSDSLRRSELLALEQDRQVQAQPQMGLVLHEAIMDGTVPRRKTPSRQRDRERDGLGAPIASTSRASPGTEMGLGLTNVARPSGAAESRGERQRSISAGALVAPVARKPVPKSDSSVNATVGSAVGSNGETLGEDDDDSLAALEIQNITGSATGTSGSISGSTSGYGNGSGNGNNGNAARGGGRAGRGKKRGRASDDLRLSAVASTSPSSGAPGGLLGVKSDGTRTPSPKVAPSAEWFDLFRRGTVPAFAGLDWVKKDSPTPETENRGKADFSRNDTATADTGSLLAAASTPDAGPSKPAGTTMAEVARKKPTFQPSALAGPSMVAYERQRSQSNNIEGPSNVTTSFYHTPVAAIYSGMSSSSLTALASTAPASSGSGTGDHRRQLSAQNVAESTLAPVATMSQPVSMSTATPQPPITRALPTISAPLAPVQPVSTTTSLSVPPHQTVSLPSDLHLHHAASAPPTRPYPQRQPPSAPLPIPPVAAPTTSFPPPPRVAPAGARPVRRLPNIPPQSPTG